MTSIENGETHNHPWHLGIYLLAAARSLENCSGVSRVDDADGCDWFDGLGVFADRLADLSVYLCLSFSDVSEMRMEPAFIWDMEGSSSW